MKTTQVNLRLEPKLMAAIEAAAEAELLDRGSMVRKLLLEALSEWRLKHALRRYQAGDISIGRACEDSGRSHWEMLDLIRVHGIARRIDVDDAMARLDRVMLKPSERVAEPSQTYRARAATSDGAVRAGGSKARHTARSPRRRRRASSRGDDSLPDFAPMHGGILVVGINPAPVSVARGHYYQGKLGSRLWKRLESLGLLTDPVPGHEDEAFVRAGHGLTDVVKRVTRSAAELDAAELRAGAQLLRGKLREWRPRLVLFAFKQAAVAALGSRAVKAGPCGEIEGAPAFLLSGPYARVEDARAIDDELRRML